MLQVQDEDFPALTRVTTWRQGTTTTTGAEKIGGTRLLLLLLLLFIDAGV